MAMSSRFLSQHEKTRYKYEESLQLVAKVDESNLENTREEYEENLQFIDDDDESSGMNKKSVLPRGYRFHPTAVELLEEYLIKKVLKQLVWDTIKEIDFYQYDPQQIPIISEFETPKYGREGRAYFFTREEQKYLKGSRLIGCPLSKGYWRRRGREVPIHNGNGIIGLKRIFVWEGPDNGEENNWDMTEYSVNPSYMKELSQTNFENYVVCKVRYTSRHKKYSRMEEEIDSLEEFIFFN